jgi:hypothetical protein
MRSALLFTAVVTLAFFVTVDVPLRPEAAFHADFDPATQVEMLRLSLQAPTLPEQIRAL